VSAGDAGNDASSDADLGFDAARPPPPPEVAPGAPTLSCIHDIHGPDRQLVHAVATAKDGRVAIVGSLYGSADFGKGTLTSAGDRDGFVAVYDSGCNALFTASYGNFQENFLSGVGFDGAGNLYLGGLNRGKMDFGNGALQTKGDYDIVVAKLDTAYALKWAFEYGDASYQVFDGFGVDDAGGVVLSGTFIGKIDFGGGAIAASATAPTGVFVAKLDTNGTQKFSKSLTVGASAGQYQATGVSVDPFGAIAITGLAPNGGSIDVGGGPVTATGPVGLFTWAALLGPSGTHVWSRAFGTIAPSHVAVTPPVDVVFEAPLQGAADFGIGAVDASAAIVRIGVDGGTIWSRGIDIPPPRAVPAVGSTAPDGALISDGFQGTADLGCGPMTSNGGYDMFHARIAPDGGCLYSLSFGDAADQGLTAAASTASGGSVLAGSYHGSVTINGVVHTSVDTEEDTFVAMFSK
jgi:hypothetical protein